MLLTHLLKKFVSSIDWVLVALQTVASRVMLVKCGKFCNETRALTFEAQGPPIVPVQPECLRQQSRETNPR